MIENRAYGGGDISGARLPAYCLSSCLIVHGDSQRLEGVLSLNLYGVPFFLPL